MKLVVTLFIFWVVGLGNGFTQGVNTPKIMNRAQFEIAINSEVTKIIAVNPLGNLHNVSYEGYYAILKIEKGKVVQIAYPEWIDPIITRQSEFALKDINERIGEKEFEFVNMDQIVIPVLIEWIHFEGENNSLAQALMQLLPNSEYTSQTYVLHPVVIRMGNPRLSP
jgi:hypothetical protein